MIVFILGIMIGVIIGVILMSLIQMNKANKYELLKNEYADICSKYSKLKKYHDNLTDIFLELSRKYDSKIESKSNDENKIF